VDPYRKPHLMMLSLVRNGTRCCSSTPPMGAIEAIAVVDHPRDNEDTSLSLCSLPLIDRLIVDEMPMRD
jgi:hypothetical protein